MRGNRLVFVYNSRIRKYDVETGKLVYNKAVRHAFETEGEDLTQKFKKYTEQVFIKFFWNKSVNFRSMEMAL